VLNTDMWLLVLGRVVKGHPNTVVSTIFDGRHY
jgi:hypothetical protein